MEGTLIPERSARRSSQVSAVSDGPCEAELYDLMIIVDATSSMSIYLEALQECLPSIISISALTGCFGRIGLLGYRDYGDKPLLEWSGWLDPAAIDDLKQPDLEQAASKMEPDGGGDWPEALKTALARAYELARPEAKVLCLLYTDAPPHVKATRAYPERYSNYLNEQNALLEKSAYGGFGMLFVDWVEGCKTLRRGEKRFEVFSFLPNEDEMDDEIVGLYNYLSTVTHGATIQLKDLKADVISKVTIETLLAWMGVEKKGESEANRNKTMRASLVRYADIKGIKEIKKETDAAATPFFITKQNNRHNIKVERNLTRVDISPYRLAKHIPKKKTPMTNFVDAWATDTAYRAVVRTHLRRVIAHNVQAMAANPVFGSLWRAVCNDRTYPQRESLIQEFSRQVEQIREPAERASMKQWLEDSYDFAAEILETIEAVPEEERFPCVCVDPTLRFVRGDPGEEDADRSIKDFTRAELLEIGRSCERPILARLSRLLTRLTYIASAAEMPDHIAVASQEKVPRIPMALMSAKYERKFWKVLLHCINPGTLLSARPAALVAALALSLCIEPLMTSAAEEMLLQRDKWNNLEVPENWNVSCLSLLLDADRANSTRSGATKRLLRPEDKALFEKLIAFHILGMNLKSELMARIGWQPNKSRASIGPLTQCRECKFPRSVTIMQRNGICGICASKEYASPEAQARAIRNEVSNDCNEGTLATWVECFIPTCRAQYVVYNVKDLNVRPKCHYCRTAVGPKAEKAPFVECKDCQSRMIWPVPLRPKSLETNDWRCPACVAQKKTIVDQETTLLELQEWNDLKWLASDKEKPSAFPLRLQMQSLFKELTSFGGPSAFAKRISLFKSSPSQLQLRGKKLHNAASILATLEGFVAQRHIGRDSCSLCFSEFRQQTGELSAACGRKGCKQRVCANCLSGWYGLNAAGRIINTGALVCPFCRKRPAGAKLRRFGNGVLAVADLQRAIDRHGRWISAWCIECGHAREYMERQCARGAPPEVENWTCEACTDRRETARREMEALRLELRAAEADAAERERLVKELEKLQMAHAKPCPSCGVMTAKSSGCDHIECTVCKTHWCYYCGEASTWKDIYNHMSAVHSGYGIDENDPGYYTEEEEWEYD